MKARDRGSAAVEAAIVVPALITIGLFMFAATRTSTASSQVRNAARAAARAAAVADNQDEARIRATAVALDTLGSESACNEAAVTSVSGFAPGANVTVTVTCTTDPVFGFLIKPRVVSVSAVEAVSGLRGGLE